MSVSLTREQMQRLRSRRIHAVESAEASDRVDWCPQARAEVSMPGNGVCLFCSTDHSHRSRLTNRQFEAFRMVADGKTRKQVAFELEVSEHTVANDWRDARKALGAKTTTQVAVMLVREGSL